MNSETQFLTSKDVMEILKISRPTLARYIRDGRIPYTKFGRENRYPVSFFTKIATDAMSSFN